MAAYPPKRKRNKKIRGKKKKAQKGSIKGVERKVFLENHMIRALAREFLTQSLRGRGGEGNIRQGLQNSGDNWEIGKSESPNS